MQITREDQARIAEAVRQAETTTAGEIYCVLTPASSEYRETPWAWAAGAALLLPPLALLAGFRPQALEILFGGWSIAHLHALDATILTALTIYIGLQTAVFALVFLIASLPRMRVALTWRGRKLERVRKAALQQFLGKGLHLTQARTGVLLFASLAEHRAEVIADEGVYAVAPREVWDEVAALLVAGLKRDDAAGGFIAAVARSGEILAAHVPPGPDNPNELPDKLVILTGPGHD